jgi:hypothetical protein
MAGATVTPAAKRVRVPHTFPSGRVIVGELHLLRGRLDGTLADLASEIAKTDRPDERWLRVEEAARLARRALAAAVGAAPPVTASDRDSELRVGELRINPVQLGSWPA